MCATKLDFNQTVATPSMFSATKQFSKTTPHTEYLVSWWIFISIVGCVEKNIAVWIKLSSPSANLEQNVERTGDQPKMLYGNQSYRGLCCTLCEWVFSGVSLANVRLFETRRSWQFFCDSTVSVIRCPWMKYRKSFILTPLGLGKRKSAKCLQQPVFPGGHPSKY